MKYIKGLTKRKLKNWVGKQWYHQRFDGSPYMMFLVSEGEVYTHMKRKQGTDFDVHFVFIENDHVDWYISMDDIKRISNKMIQLGKKNPNISSDFIKRWKKDEELFFKKCFEISKIDLTKLSNNELIKLHDDLKQIYVNRCSSSSTIDGFALGTDELIADKIKKVYDEKKLKQRFSEIFSTLTAPVHLSFINEAELSLLNVALKKINIENHQKDYFWINNNYVDSYVLDAKYFQKELKRLSSMKIDIKKEINKLKNTPLVNKKKKKTLIKKLKLDPELKLLIKISEDFTYWQDERKKSTLWATHYFSLLLKEISKRAKISLHEIKYMFPAEVSLIFNNKADKKILQQRIKNSVYFTDKQGLEALYGKDADEIKNKILGSTDLSDVDDFRGLTASMGKATGKVKILKSVKEIGKIEQGDILVAVMTRPDYVPAMKKAAAIVTDEGGVTSHAAIVSRELGIPCIIGTKIATKVLKDGDLVEVNANHSWVKIIK